MEKETQNSDTSIVFGIAFVIAAIIFGLFLNDILPDSYNFFQKALIFVGSGFAGFVVLALAGGFVNAVYKAIIEILVVALVLINAVTISFTWINFDYIVDGNTHIAKAIGIDSVLFTILAAALSLFVLNVITVFVLLPLARLANSSVLEM